MIAYSYSYWVKNIPLFLIKAIQFSRACVMAVTRNRQTSPSLFTKIKNVEQFNFLAQIRQTGITTWTSHSSLNSFHLFRKLKLEIFKIPKWILRQTGPSPLVLVSFIVCWDPSFPNYLHVLIIFSYVKFVILSRLPWAHPSIFFIFSGQ